MDEGKRCPWCHDDIGLWAVMRAAWPTMIKCPTCGSKLAYEIILWRFILTQALPPAIGIAFLACALSYLIFQKIAIKPLMFALLLFVIFWIVFELLIARHWQKHKKLIIMTKKFRPAAAAKGDQPATDDPNPDKPR